MEQSQQFGMVMAALEALNGQVEQLNDKVDLLINQSKWVILILVLVFILALIKPKSQHSGDQVQQLYDQADQLADFLMDQATQLKNLAWKMQFGAQFLAGPEGPDEDDF